MQGYANWGIWFWGEVAAGAYAGYEIAERWLYEQF